jgi:hypothetical protein
MVKNVAKLFRFSKFLSKNFVGKFDLLHNMMLRLVVNRLFSKVGLSLVMHFKFWDIFTPK